MLCLNTRGSIKECCVQETGKRKVALASGLKADDFWWWSLCVCVCCSVPQLMMENQSFGATPKTLTEESSPYLQIDWVNKEKSSFT